MKYVKNKKGAESPVQPIEDNMWKTTIITRTHNWLSYCCFLACHWAKRRDEEEVQEERKGKYNHVHPSSQFRFCVCHHAWVWTIVDVEEKSNFIVVPVFTMTVVCVRLHSDRILCLCKNATFSFLANGATAKKLCRVQVLMLLDNPAPIQHSAWGPFNEAGSTNSNPEQQIWVSFVNSE